MKHTRFFALMGLGLALLTGCGDKTADTYLLKMNWPPAFNMKLDTRLSYNVKKGDGSYAQETRHEFHYDVAKKRTGYHVTYISDKKVVNKSKPKTAALLYLLGEIQSSPGFLINHKGEVTSLLGLVEYRDLLIARANALTDAGPGDIKKLVASFRNETFSRKNLSELQRDWLYLLSLWVNKSIQSRGVYSGLLPEWSPNLYGVKPEYQVEYQILRGGVYGKNRTVTIEIVERIAKPVLDEMLEVQELSKAERAKKKKYHYRITRILKTDPDTLLPLSYSVHRDVHLPKSKEDYIYDVGFSYSMKDPAEASN
ncbi:MAG: hypothetical protein ACI9BD_000708 [Candidatus Marinamargulisbacteria bacterium]|jgi:hypothetical protein